MKKKPAKRLQRKDMKKTKGGAAGDPVARYHLENAWPSKALEAPTFKSTP